MPEVVLAVQAVEVWEQAELKEVLHPMCFPGVEELGEVVALRPEVLPEVEQDAAFIGLEVDDVAADLGDAAVESEVSHIYVSDFLSTRSLNLISEL